ncbi:MAG: DNA-processing protein DprA [Actinomycetaceae bacterium]|nr:DNA-processing protein DprA [Actinomycetaceae bacterium]
MLTNEDLYLEREAAKFWTYVCEGADEAAHLLIDEHGYVGALTLLVDFINQGEQSPSTPDAQRHFQRWALRLHALRSGKDSRLPLAVDTRSLAAALGTSNEPAQLLQGFESYGQGSYRQGVESQGARAFPTQGADEPDSGCEFVCPLDPDWPSCVSALGLDAPLGLWYRGDIRALSQPGITMVGSRASTRYGEKIAHSFAGEFSHRGYTVISGGAFGIDAFSHQGCLDAGGTTVCVLACGVDRAYPRAHAELFSNILASSGVIVSEYPPRSEPFRYRFLARNRLVAALGAVTLVVEAPFRSGAISTANHALTIGRPLGAIPGSLTMPSYQGCLRLLRQGAICITRPEDVLELIPDEGQTSTPMKGKQERGGSGKAAHRLSGKRQHGSTGTAWRASAAAHVAEDDEHHTDAELRTRAWHRQLESSASELAVRCAEGLTFRRGASVEQVAARAGVSIKEALAGLGELSLRGFASTNGTLWKLNRSVGVSPR